MKSERCAKAESLPRLPIAFSFILSILCPRQSRQSTSIQSIHLHARREFSPSRRLWPRPERKTGTLGTRGTRGALHPQAFLLDLLVLGSCPRQGHWDLTLPHFLRRQPNPLPIPSRPNPSHLNCLRLALRSFGRPMVPTPAVCPIPTCESDSLEWLGGFQA